MANFPVITTENLKVLYVEDDRASRQIMELVFKRILNIKDVAILDSNDGFADMLGSLPGVANLVFLDIHMKPYDGYQMLGFIRQNPAWQDVIVVALTASVLVHEVQDLKKAGFNGLIGKPINPDYFTEYLKQILAGEEVWNPLWD
jgi:two-component system cell cycle response regulator DivK